MLGIGFGTPHLVMLSVRQAQCATKSRFPFLLLCNGKHSAARRDSEASQTGCFVMDYLADDVSLIHLDCACFRNQNVGIFFQYVS